MVRICIDKKVMLRQVLGNGDPFQKKKWFLFVLSDRCFKIGEAFTLNVSLAIHLKM